MTLRALIDWSYDLLKEPEKTMLRRLSIFAGGWTLARPGGLEDIIGRFGSTPEGNTVLPVFAAESRCADMGRTGVGPAAGAAREGADFTATMKRAKAGPKLSVDSGKLPGCSICGKSRLIRSTSARSSSASSRPLTTTDPLRRIATSSQRVSTSLRM